MGKQFDALNEAQQQFIAEQKMFFVATAPHEGHVNLSPKGMDSFRVLSPNAVAWLNVTGSGNETATHVTENGRMTIMFCAFEGKPMILRLYGQARVFHPRDPEWNHYMQWFTPIPGARQIFTLPIEFVQISCGMAVPLYQYQNDRELLRDWAVKKGESGIHEYWRDRNSKSIDGKATGILDSCLPDTDTGTGDQRA